MNPYADPSLISSPYIGGGDPDNNRLIANIYFDFVGSIRTDEEKAQYIHRFRAECVRVFGTVNGLDMSQVSFQELDETYDPNNRLHNVLTVGGFADDPDPNVQEFNDQTGTSYINGDRTTGFMYWSNGDPTSYAAHEFGHLFGLKDRYIEGVIRDGKNVSGRATAPLYLSQQVDPEYNPFDNMYSTGSDVLTPKQMEILLNTNKVEQSYGTGHNVMIFEDHEVQGGQVRDRAIQIGLDQKPYTWRQGEPRGGNDPENPPNRNERLGLYAAPAYKNKYAKVAHHTNGLKYNSKSTKNLVEHSVYRTKKSGWQRVKSNNENAIRARGRHPH